MARFVSALLLLILCLLLNPASAQVPERARALLPLVYSETDRLWPSVPMRSYIPGLVEHESCVSLSSSRCWSPKSRLKTPREEGAGIGQLTRAYRADGGIRFDALSDMRKRYPAELSELQWSNVYDRPDLQIRALLLMSCENFKITRLWSNDPMQSLMFADAAYNGGLGGLKRERAACNLSNTCNPAIWAGNVERFCLKSRVPLYAGRSACDINRQHVVDVMRRSKKYQ